MICLRLSVFFFIHFLSQKRQHRIIVFRYMWKTASGAVLVDPPRLVFPEDRSTRTVRIRIHRTVTEQAVEVSALHICMAGKIFTISVFKKALAVLHFPQFLSWHPLPSRFILCSGLLLYYFYCTIFVKFFHTSGASFAGSFFPSGSPAPASFPSDPPPHSVSCRQNNGVG